MKDLFIEHLYRTYYVSDTALGAFQIITDLIFI